MTTNAFGRRLLRARLERGAASEPPRQISQTDIGMLNKIRQGHHGWEYGVAWLRARGAPAKNACESWRAWVDRSLAGWRRVYHPGNLAYVFGLDDAARSALLQLHRGGLPFAKPPHFALSA